MLIFVLQRFEKKIKSVFCVCMRAFGQLFGANFAFACKASFLSYQLRVSCYLTNLSLFLSVYFNWFYIIICYFAIFS